MRLSDRMRGRHLDARARGAAPTPLTDPALALRARRLLAPRSRARIADGIDAVCSRTSSEPIGLSVAGCRWRNRAIVAARPELRGA